MPQTFCWWHLSAFHSFPDKHGSCWPSSYSCVWFPLVQPLQQYGEFREILELFNPTSGSQMKLNGPCLLARKRYFLLFVDNRLTPGKLAQSLTMKFSRLIPPLKFNEWEASLDHFRAITWNVWPLKNDAKTSVAGWSSRCQAVDKFSVATRRIGSCTASTGTVEPVVENCQLLHTWHQCFWYSRTYYAGPGPISWNEAVTGRNCSTLELLING